MTTYIKSPVFYMGNKFKLISQLMPLFPKKINTFYDLFGGSGVMSINVDSNLTIYNEINTNIYELVKLFKTHDSLEIIDHIESRISEYSLPKLSCDVRVKHYTEEYKKNHEVNYLKFRNYYNESKRDYLDLYTLTFFSFCNLIRFNQKDEFNMPFGNRCFLEQHKEQIKIAGETFKCKNITLKNEDALTLIISNNLLIDDFVYCDPPYLNTLAVYNEKRAFGGWNIEDDYRLFKILEKLNDNGIKWGLSNVFENKGIKNEHLISWCKTNGWNVNHLNCNYASLGKGSANTDEVYICNYQTNKQISLFDFEEMG